MAGLWLASRTDSNEKDLIVQKPDLSDLIKEIDPYKTVLFFGAGAAESSGAPLAFGLKEILEDRMNNGESISQDLAETTSILQLRRGREALIDEVRSILSPLQPDGSLVALAAYGWPKIFSTNYDYLIERAFSKSQKELSVVRGDDEWEKARIIGGTILFKIHGCLSRDYDVPGKARMLLTEEDFENFESFRELLLKDLEISFAGNSVIIIGHSLKDPHIQSILKESIRIQKSSYAPGRIFLILYHYDEERARLWQGRGIHSIYEGGINDLAQKLADLSPVMAPQEASASKEIELPHRLMSCTMSVSDIQRHSNPEAMFSGKPANYTEIKNGFTFKRTIESQAVGQDKKVLVITGAVGVGKSTAARRIVYREVMENGVLGFEHRNQFDVLSSDWINFEKKLREAEVRGVLLIDDCTSLQRDVNKLSKLLPEDSYLRVILTAETSVWRIRQKDRSFFSEGQILEMGDLDSTEIADLSRLILTKGEFRNQLSHPYIEYDFNRIKNFIESRASSDMFVCFRYIFSSENFDDIILREFNSLPSVHQEIYKTTAAIEAAGGFAHRQMVIRMVHFELIDIGAILHVLDRIIFESERQSSLGIYIWSCRHEIISNIVTKYKYADQQELIDFLDNLISSVVPTYREESKLLSEICSAKYGIRAVASVDERIALYRKIIQKDPKQRVVRHRIVRDLLMEKGAGEAEIEIRRAEEDVGADAPLLRYSIMAQIKRTKSEHLSISDKKAILKGASDRAKGGINKYPENMYMYIVLMDVAEAWWELNGDINMAKEAKIYLEKGFDRTLEPRIQERIRQFDRRTIR